MTLPDLTDALNRRIRLEYTTESEDRLRVGEYLFDPEKARALATFLIHWADEQEHWPWVNGYMVGPDVHLSHTDEPEWDSLTIPAEGTVEGRLAPADDPEWDAPIPEPTPPTPPQQKGAQPRNKSKRRR